MTLVPSPEQPAADLRSLGRGAAGLALVALRSFLGTLLVVLTAGVVLAGLSAYLLRSHPFYAWVAAAVALAESFGVGVLLGGKRAVVLALVHGVRSLHLGRAVVRLIIERLLNVSVTEGGTLAGAAEGLPLAQAERRLTAVVGQVVGDPTAWGGWWRRRLQARLLAGVQKYTLSRFREEGARHGGVNLVKLQTELEATVDDRLIGKLRAGLNLWTVLVILGLPGVVFAQTYLLMALLNAK